jgi:hypothetical protein
MATTRSFSAMLNEYLTNELLMEELIKRDWLLSQVAKDEDWKGGDVIVPFRGAQASSIKFGGLTSSTDISENKYVRGKISAYREVWGSMVFNETDLQQHDGKIPESTFLKILPDTIDDFMDNFKEVVSFQMLAGPHFAKVTDSTNAATGIMVVDRIDKFILNQHLTIDDDNSSPTDCYVIAIDINASTVTLSDSRGGGAFNFSAYTAGQNAKFYYDGVWDGTNSISFQSLKDAFLSAANGGGASLHGQTKLAYPYLQAVNVDGASITATNILDKIFDAYVTIRTKARGKATKIVMSFKHWGSIMKSQQIEKGAYKLINDPKRSEYGWFEITLASTTKGEALNIVAVQEMPDDVIMFLDPSSIKFLSNGGFKKRVGPDGLMYFTVRNTTGYQYIVDTCVFGEQQVTKPGNNGILYGISY